MLGNRFMSFMRVFLFWWILSILIFGFMEPETSLAFAQSLASRFGFSVSTLPAKADILNAYEIQLWVLYRWTLPLALLGVGSFLVGLYLARRRFKDELDTRTARETGKGEFRGMTISMDILPIPEGLPRLPLALSGPSAEKIMGSMTEGQRSLFIEVLETLHAHPRAFVGDGHFGNLLEHSLNVVERLIGKADEHCPLAFVAAAAHDLGKIEAWKEVGLPKPAEEPNWLKSIRVKAPSIASPVLDLISAAVTPATPELPPNTPRSWEQISGLHDQISARMVVRLPSYVLLPQHERDALYFSLAYDHSRTAMPQLPTEKADRLARKLMSLVQEADSKATKEEKTKVLESIPVEAQVIRAFRDALPGLQFQAGEAAGAKKQATAGFHLGNGLVIFFENQLREKCMDRLPPETRAALGGEHRDQGRLGDFSALLIKEFNKLGWLVTEWDKWEGSELTKVDARLWTKVKTGEKWTLPVNEAVWNIISNVFTYNCMIIVQLPEEMMYTLPPKTKYRIVVKEPHFKRMRGPVLKEPSVSDQASIVKSADILGGLLSPIPTPKPAEIPAASQPTAPVVSAPPASPAPAAKVQSTPASPARPTSTAEPVRPSPPATVPVAKPKSPPPAPPRPLPTPLANSDPLAGLFSTSPVDPSNGKP